MRPVVFLPFSAPLVLGDGNGGREIEPKGKTRSHSNIDQKR